MSAPRPTIPDDVRAVWQDLADRYRFLYDMTIQERLDRSRMRGDMSAWWSIGGKHNPTPTHSG